MASYDAEEGVCHALAVHTKHPADWQEAVMQTVNFALEQFALSFDDCLSVFDLEFLGLAA